MPCRTAPILPQRAVLRDRPSCWLQRAAERDLASACQLGLEGVIGKRRGSRYASGRRRASR